MVRSSSPSSSSSTTLTDNDSPRRLSWKARRGCPGQSSVLSRKWRFWRVRSRLSAVQFHFLSRGLPLTLAFFSVTDVDGRCMTLLPPRDSEGAKQVPHFQIAAGIYKIVFKPQEYFEKTGRKCFYPWIEVIYPTHASSLLTRLHTDILSNRKSRRALPHSSPHQPVFIHHL